MNTQGSQDARQREKFWQGRSYATRKELVMKPSEKWAYLADFAVDDIEFIDEPLSATKDLLVEIASLEAPYTGLCFDNVELESINAELVEALEGMSNWFDSDGYATSVPPRVLVFSMRQALAKARGES